MSAQIADRGFANPNAARLIVQRLKLRARLQDAKASVEALLDVLDHGFEADRDAISAIFDQAGNLVASNPERAEGDGPVDHVGSNDVSEKELLDGVELVLQFFDALGVGLRHGLFSRNDFSRLTCADGYSHRLCEVSE